MKKFRPKGPAPVTGRARLDELKRAVGVLQETVYRDGSNQTIDGRTAHLLRAVRECITILTEAHSDFSANFESEKVRLERQIRTLGELNFSAKEISRRLGVEQKQVAAILDRADLAAWVRR